VLKLSGSILFRAEHYAHIPLELHKRRKRRPVPDDATMSTSSSPTQLIHYTYEGNFQLDCTSKVLSCRVSKKTSNNETNDESSSNNKEQVNVEIELDVTTMHPQGGGQPTDHGTISSPESSVTAKIDKVAIDHETKVVTHAGTVNISYSSVSFEIGSVVHVSVDPRRRRLLSECHTAGHVVDAAMARCDRVLPPTKGYHFLDGPYVVRAVQNKSWFV